MQEKTGLICAPSYDVALDFVADATHFNNFSQSEEKPSAATIPQISYRSGQVYNAGGESSAIQKGYDIPI